MARWKLGVGVSDGVEVARLGPRFHLLHRGLERSHAFREGFLLARPNRLELQ